MKRRDFITKTTAATALLSLNNLELIAAPKIKTKHVTIIHTNDVHSNIETYSANHHRYANLGGAAKRAAGHCHATARCRAPRRRSTGSRERRSPRG